MKKQFLGIFIGICIFVFTACQKETIDIDPINQEPDNISLHEKINVENGIIVFNTIDDFKEIINSFSDSKSSNSLINHPDFISLHNRSIDYEKKGEDGIEGDTLVLSDAFASVLNYNREIIVQGIMYKVCVHGTLFACSEDSADLRAIAELETVSDLIIPTNESLLEDNQINNLFTFKDKKNIFLYDTYGLYIPDKEKITFEATKSDPDYNTFPTITENSRTLFGKGWDFLFGFSVSKDIKFDSKHVVDVKFYAQNFVILSETGIKVKTQKKNGLGIWSKTKSDELRAGWDYLEIKEKWSSVTKKMMEQMYNEIPSYQDPQTLEYNKWLGISTIEFPKKTFLTVDIIGHEFKITNKDIYKKSVGEAIRWIKHILPSSSTKESDIDGIREFSTNFPESAITKIGKYEQIATNDDKLTVVIKQDFGFIVGVKIKFGNPNGTVYTPTFSGIAKDYEILKASMYGCARRGNEWRGLRLNYKYQ